MAGAREDGPNPARIAALLGAGVLDAELAALLWLLVEARLPFVVAGEPARCRELVRSALLDLLPVGTSLLRLTGDDASLDRLPEAAELGWRAPARQGTSGGSGSSPGTAPGPGSTVLVADLRDGPAGTWGGRARTAIRAVAIGYGMAATAEGGRLEDALGRLSAPPVAAIDDELTRLGVVLVLAADEAVAAGGRVAAAHYLRPVQRDLHGHVQRMPPAVLATWDTRSGRFEHFAWGIVDELAGRTGRRPLDLEGEQARRAARLTTLAAAGGGAA